LPPEDNTGGAPAASPVVPEQSATPAVAEVVSEAAAAPAAGVPPTAEAPPAAPEAPAPGEAKPAIGLHTDTPSLIATAADPLATKPAVDPAAAAKPGDPPIADPAAALAVVGAAEPVKYEAFTLPEGVTLQPERVDEFTALLGNTELAPQARAQQLVDMHVNAMQSYAEGIAADQHKAFGEMRRGWRTEVMADEELGGAGHQTAMNAIARMRDMLVPSARREAFNRAMDLTGAGDHPEILRVFHAAARLFDEPAPMHDPPKPPPNNGRRPSAGAHGGFYETVGSGPGPAAPNK
jgi:hypothetical protein